MKRLLTMGLIVFIAFVLMGCPSNDSNDKSKKVDINEINIDASDHTNNESLPFDVEAFEENYFEEYDSFIVDYKKELEEDDAEDELEVNFDSKANITFEDIKLLFKDGQLTEAVVFLSILDDMVDGEDEAISDFASDFIENVIDDRSFAAEMISDGLEIKIGAEDSNNISIGIYTASEEDEL